VVPVGTGPSPAPSAVGVIGLGEIGQVHAAGIRQSRAARLVAVADTAPGLLPPFEADGVRGYRDATALIADAEERIYDAATVLPSPDLG
jgi:predicted dehydrogenase